jgi:hypothetical protein
MISSTFWSTTLDSLVIGKYRLRWSVNSLSMCDADLMVRTTSRTSKRSSGLLTSMSSNLEQADDSIDFANMTAIHVAGPYLVSLYSSPIDQTDQAVGGQMHPPIQEIERSLHRQHYLPRSILSQSIVLRIFLRSVQSCWYVTMPLSS